MKILAMLATAGAALAISTAANATIINFDGLGGTGEQVANGYGGLNWDNFYSLDGTHRDVDGYHNGVVSADNVVYNSFENDAAISAISGTFTFNGGFFTGAWNNDLTLNLAGYNGATLLFSGSYNLQSTGPLHVVTNWTGVDKVVFSSSGGTPAGYSGSGTHFALDNLEVNGVASVPEPASWALMIVGVGLAGATLRRQRQVAIAA